MIIESDNSVCEIESIITNNKSDSVLRKEYEVNDVKLFRLDNGNQHCKILVTSDGMNIIPVCFLEIIDRICDVLFGIMI
jgi:hypothetical protein